MTPRIRTIKPSFFLDEDLAALPFEARLLFAGLWCLADKAGRLEDRPKRIHAMLFPYEPKVDVDGLLGRLAAANFIVRYEVDGRGLIQVRSFERHQRPNHREADSELPPCVPGHAQVFPGMPGQDRGEGTGREGKGKERKESYVDLGADAPNRPRPLSEIDWRVEQTWRAHLAQWRGYYQDSNGKAPIREPSLTQEIRDAIKVALKEYDAHLLKPDQREAWLAGSKARAAGIGIFLDPFLTGQSKDNDLRNGGKRYLEHWRPWKVQRGKGSPVDRFAELYYEAKSLTGDLRPDPAELIPTQGEEDDVAF